LVNASNIKALYQSNAARERERALVSVSSFEMMEERRDTHTHTHTEESFYQNVNKYQENVLVKLKVK
jgi:hypothetical protein